MGNLRHWLRRQPCNSHFHDEWSWPWLTLGTPRASLVAQLVKDLSAMQEIWIQLLGGKDLLEEISCLGNLAWDFLPGKSYGQRSLAGLQSMGSQRADSTNTFTFTGGSVENPPAIWETWVRFLGWEDPLDEGMAIHSSILTWRIPMDRGAWWATIHEVTKRCT